MTVSPLACHACKRTIRVGEAYCSACRQRQFAGDGPLWSGERRLVTILVADLASFTAMSEDADPEDIIDLLNQIFSRLMVECDQEGGYLDKILGDQLMVLFGAPQAHEDDPVRAVRAALNMQAAMKELVPFMRERVGKACRLKIGINTGVVVWGLMGPSGRAVTTVIGDAVNLAYRLEQFAKGGQIIVSDPVYFLTRSYFEYEILNPIRVKGKSRLVPVYVPLRLRQSARSQKQVFRLKSPLLEREHALQTLHAHWARTISNQGKFILVNGEAGLGKSRLVTEFIYGVKSYVVQKQPVFLQTHSSAAPQIGTYSPLINLLSQLFNLSPGDSDLLRRQKIVEHVRTLGMAEDTGSSLVDFLLGWVQAGDHLSKPSPEADHLRESAVEAAVTIFLKQSLRRPTFLMIDDLQDADAGTFDWLNRLAAIMQAKRREQAGYQLMVLAATRPRIEMSIELPPADEVIKLEPISETACRDLIADLLPGTRLPAALVESISNESGGNPFYLEEVCRGLVDSDLLVKQGGSWRLSRPVDQIIVPHSIEGLVMSRLDALSPEARAVLQYASAIGAQFSYDLLSAITPVQNLDQALYELKQCGLINEMNVNGTGRSFGFAQKMVHEVVYRTLLRKTRRELDQQIALLSDQERPA